MRYSLVKFSESEEDTYIYLFSAFEWYFTGCKIVLCISSRAILHPLEINNHFPYRNNFVWWDSLTSKGALAITLLEYGIETEFYIGKLHGTMLCVWESEYLLILFFFNVAWRVCILRGGKETLQKKPDCAAGPTNIFIFCFPCSV